MHLKQGQKRFFSLQAFQTPEKSEDLRLLGRGDKGLYKSDIFLYAFTVCRVAGIWFEVHKLQGRPIPTYLSGDTDHLHKCNWRILLF